MDLVSMVMACSMYADNSVVNAMVNLNSNDNPLVISGKPFPTEQAALAYAQQLQAQDEPFTIGLMQIPSRWLKDYPVSLHELLRPCKNMVLATQILIATREQCSGSQACALSIYQTGDPQAGLNYANQILQYATDHPFVPPPPKELTDPTV